MKKLWKQSGKRAVAMLLALTMVLSFAQTGLAVTAHAAQNSQSASAGALVANAYGAELKEWEKSILRSGYLKGNTYTYQAPSENNSDGLVSVDADSKTVTVKSYRDAQGLAGAVLREPGCKRGADRIDHRLYQQEKEKPARVGGVGKVVDYLQTSTGFLIVIVLPVFLFFLYHLIQFFRALFEYQNVKNRIRYEQERGRTEDLIEEQKKQQDEVRAKIEAELREKLKKELLESMKAAQNKTEDKPEEKTEEKSAELAAEEPKEEPEAEKSEESKEDEAPAEAENTEEAAENA